MDPRLTIRATMHPDGTWGALIFELVDRDRDVMAGMYVTDIEITQFRYMIGLAGIVIARLQDQLGRPPTEPQCDAIEAALIQRRAYLDAAA